MEDYSAMAFPKSSWGKQKKKRKKHRESIIQKKGDKRCLLCMLKIVAYNSEGTRLSKGE